MRNRRTFIKFLGVIGGALMLPFQKMGYAHTEATQAKLPPGAELYAGFVLLPEGNDASEFVKPPRLGPPIECGAGRDLVQPTAETMFVANFSDGLPNYKSLCFLKEIPFGFQKPSKHILKHQSGEVFSATEYYESDDINKDGMKRLIRLVFHFDFPKPYPIPKSISQRTNILPTDGVMILTPFGYVFHWISNEILHTLIIDNVSTQDDALAIAKLTVAP